MWRRYLDVVASLIPIGAAGASILLGSALPSDAAERPAASPGSVSDRLNAIQQAAVAAGRTAKITDPNYRLTWGNRWNNWGWRPGWGPRPRWNNWRNGWPNWNNFWRNW